MGDIGFMLTGPHIYRRAPADIQAEERWLKGQIMRLRQLAATTQNARLLEFADWVNAILATDDVGDFKKYKLRKLEDLVNQDCSKGGFGGYMPRQVKNHPKLRKAIRNLYVREWGAGAGRGDMFRTKNSASGRA